MATQNPIEQLGTYNLPEAQVDRFLYKLVVQYSSREDLKVILDRTTTGFAPKIEPVMNREEIIDGVLLGLGKPATGPYKPGTWAYNQDVRAYPYDPQKAKALLAEAGWRDTDGDGTLDNQGKPFEFELITNQGNEVRRQVAELLELRRLRVGQVAADLLLRQPRAQALQFASRLWIAQGLDLGPRQPGLDDPDLLAQKLGQWGVGANTQVAVYDDSFGSMAVRLWWLLRWLGHESVALLDGGLPRWKRDKFPLSQETPAIQPATFPAKPNRAAWVDVAEVEAARRETRRRIVDARPEERFTGEIEPLDKIAGHIPHSCNWSFEENLDLGGTLLPADELREAYLKLLAGQPAESIIHTCGSGVTACHNILAMEIAGLSGSKLYPGSWSEWITDPARPVETGEAGLAPGHHEGGGHLPCA